MQKQKTHLELPQMVVVVVVGRLDNDVVAGCSNKRHCIGDRVDAIRKWTGGDGLDVCHPPNPVAVDPPAVDVRANIHAKGKQIGNPGTVPG